MGILGAMNYYYYSNAKVINNISTSLYMFVRAGIITILHFFDTRAQKRTYDFL